MRTELIDRSWAEHITDQDFEREYTRRFPWSDVLPSRRDYLQSKADATAQMRLPTAEDFEQDTGLGHTHISESDAGHLEQDKLSCVECARAFGSEHALKVHRGKAHQEPMQE